MGNLIANLLSKANPLGQALGMGKALQSGNPLAILTQMDPRMQQVLDYIQQQGGDPRVALNNLAKEKGKDPSEAIRNAQNMLSGLK